MAQTTTQLEGGTYEILRNRLLKDGQELRARLEQLNQERKAVFGATETALLATERVTTEHNCVPWDMVPVGFSFVFGYNVHLGLKTEVALADVFSVYRYQDHSFHEEPLALIGDQAFVDDFQKLYTYYKHTQFVKFAVLGTHLFMVFRVGKGVNDIKTFRWAIQGDTLTYLDNRSDHEFTYPAQHDFTWTRPAREAQRKGKFPHLSIEDKVFVETLHGDLTIKVEDNTDSGHGLYAEPVEDKDQTLDDMELYYTVIGNLILLKIRPYRENRYRYLVYNVKLQEVRRIDALELCCILLPDNHGIIYAYGYYLQTGTFKQFDNGLQDMVFEKRIASPNGEDFLYVFYNKETGVYQLLSYNLITQQIDPPIICHGYTIFENGELLFFRADDEPKKHHALQIWRTPYLGSNFPVPVTKDSYLYKIGNKDLVRAMAEGNEVLTLLQQEDSYANLYLDLIKKTTYVLDSYHWLSRPEVFALTEPLTAIRQTANAAVEEYEKVVRIRQSTQTETERVLGQADQLLQRITFQKPEHIGGYVQYLGELRAARGQVISLQELRYADQERIAAADQRLQAVGQDLANQTVAFLLQPEALKPYERQVQEINAAIGQVARVVEADATDQTIGTLAAELELLIEVVSNLQIDDATQTTRIIDAISVIYATFNQTKAALRRKRQELLSQEGHAEFAAQFKLLNQSVIHYLDLCDSPAKCEEYLAKLMVQLEELEGRFPDFEAFLEQIASKREELYNAFETKKVTLVEARNKRASNLQQAADRMLQAVQSRLAKLPTAAEINGFFAADLMIGKVRTTVEELLALQDTVKADAIQSRLKTLKEDALRQLKDKQDLFEAGTNVVRFGPHRFTVNTQPLELSVVYRGGEMFFHLTGTNFFEKITDPEFLGFRPVWEQTLVSENQEVYRAEYLAFRILEAAQQPRAKQAEEAGFRVLTLDELHHCTEAELTAYVQQFMAGRLPEGYVKGVHDHDAALLLAALVRQLKTADLLRYDSASRACARLYWQAFAPDTRRQLLDHQLKGVGLILQVFPHTTEFDHIVEELRRDLGRFQEETGLVPEADPAEAAAYLFHELTRGNHFVTDAEAAALYQDFRHHLTEQKVLDAFETSVSALAKSPVQRFGLMRHWLRAYITQTGRPNLTDFVAEATVLLFTDDYSAQHVLHVQLREALAGMQGTHPVLQEQVYPLQFHAFRQKLARYTATVAPQFAAFGELKKHLTHAFAEELRLQEFKPRVLSSFVRNQLIDQVYLPLIGANLAKQMGTAGENKRTDLMGLLLLLSPPGYGKTTLMEYIANRLGLIFMKINGPALGHQVTALDPAEAPNGAAREELEKLNLALEMGDNVMLYLDDIQHCHPELLQKFISLCDAQRKIEGTYKGRSKTYDFRGRKVCVVMAGNPYTETGEKFRIPDMLANRADIYNLGDIIGDTAEVFKASYLENALTSNPVLAKLASKSPEDLQPLLQLVQTGSSAGLTFAGNHQPEELTEYTQVLQKLLRIRDVILTVNQEYIRSAAQADEYRTEPPFKLQGSYRNMNKLAEKVMPILNDQELTTLLLAHYEAESQTLTTGAEANLLKFKELVGWLTPTEATRWDAIKTTFVRNLKLRSFGNSDQTGQVLAQMEQLSEGLQGIKEALVVRQEGRLRLPEVN